MGEAAAAAISGGVNVLGSILGFQSNKNTNKTNLQIARETNDANRELATMQNDWNIDMWNRNNEYNTFANQLDRWKSAGLNPNAFQAQDSNGQQIQSADLANQQQPSTGQQSYDPSQSLVQGVNTFMQYQIGKAQADAQLESAKAQTEQAKTAQYDAYTRRQMLPYQQSALDAQARNGYTEAFNAQTMLPYQIDAQRAYTLFHRSSAEQAEANRKFLNIQAENAFREGNWIDRRMYAMVKNLNSQSYANMMSGYLSGKQADVAVQEAQRVWADKNLKNWDSKIKKLEYNLYRQGINPHNTSWVGTLLNFAGQNFDQQRFDSYMNSNSHMNPLMSY